MDEVIIEKGKAVGVKLSNGKILKANVAVVSNASAWDTLRLIDPQHVPAEWSKSVKEIPINRSFMHAHVGFDAAGRW